MAVAAQNARVLIVDDNLNALRALEYVLDREGFQVDCAVSGQIALERLRKAHYDAVVSDLKMPGMTGLELVDRIHGAHPAVPVLILTAHGSIDTAVTAVRRGAVDFLEKPFQTAGVADKLRSVLAEREPASPEPKPAAGPDRVGVEAIVGASEVMKQVVARIQTVARKHITVMIGGESGTGKELAARAIHLASPRCDRPFVAVNCATIPETLLENELFGHVKGAYTGANSNQRGLFEEAHTGTIFLDEIGDVPASIQAKLLRVLQEKEFKKVGGTRDIRVDVRVVTATNKELREAVAAGRFREDLFYRINVVPIRLPALRERAEDIPLLANHFRTLFNVELGLSIKRFEDAAMAAMVNFSWPGNVRELRNRVKMSMVMAEGQAITAENLGFAESDDGRPFPPFSQAKESFERDYILKALKICAGNVKKAARIAGRDRSTFYDLLKKYDISADSFRDLY